MGIRKDNIKNSREPKTKIQDKIYNILPKKFRMKDAGGYSTKTYMKKGIVTDSLGLPINFLQNLDKREKITESELEFFERLDKIDNRPGLSEKEVRRAVNDAFQNYKKKTGVAEEMRSIAMKKPLEYVSDDKNYNTIKAEAKKQYINNDRKFKETRIKDFKDKLPEYKNLNDNVIEKIVTDYYYDQDSWPPHELVKEIANSNK